MRLDQVSAVLRPRSSQEAADLGMAMVRRHAGGIFKAWLALLLPLWTLLIVLLRDYPSVTVFVVWWLKPLYDRVVLFYLSRALFGDAPALRAQIRAWPRLLTRRLGSALLWGRFSGARSFVLPVLQLENLTGKPGRLRAATLKRHSGGAAASVTTMTGLLEAAVWAGLLMGIQAFLPEEYTEPVISGSLLSNYSAIPMGLLWSVAACYLVAVALVEPFYAGAGFGLYINTRTHLEGWDVEVVFRRLGERLRARPGGAVPPSAPAGETALTGPASVSGASFPPSLAKGISPVRPPLPPPPAPPGFFPPAAHAPPPFPPPLPGSGSGPGSGLEPGPEAENPPGFETVPPLPAAAAPRLPVRPVPVNPGFPPKPPSSGPLTLLLLLAASAWFFLSSPAAAQEEVDVREAGRQIREVTAHPDFIRHTEKYKVWEPDPASKPPPPASPPAAEGWDWSWLNLSWLSSLFSGNWLEVTLRLLLVAATLALAVWLGYGIFKNRQLLFRKGAGRPEFRGPRTVMGLEIAPESLPDDIPGEAWAAWSRGESEAGVRLLYRGALTWLVERGALPVRESDTEGDCLRHAATLTDSALSGYFTLLTAARVDTAYGGLRPEAEAMRDLCGRWPFALTAGAAAGNPNPPGSGKNPGSGKKSGPGTGTGTGTGTGSGSGSGSGSGPDSGAGGGSPAAGSRHQAGFSSSSAASALLAVAALLMLTGCGRFVEKERELGHKGEARRDPWLAAARFLRMNDYPVDSMRGFLNLPPHSTALIVPSDAITSEALANIALRWARDGGHLIYLVHGGGARRDDWESTGHFKYADGDTAAQPMLTALGLSLERLGGTPRITAAEIGGTSLKISLAEEVTLDTVHARRPVDLTAGPENAAALASLRCGQGRVTVLTSAHPFRNRFISDDDNAALLLALARMDSYTDAVRFIKAGRVNLWDMLMEHAWMAVTGLAALLAVWLWRYVPRFGPVQALSLRSQRRFATHLEEAGYFFWRHRLSDVLLAAPRQAVITAARRRALRETERQFIPLLAAWSGLPEDRVRQAMESGEIRDARLLTQRVADLQKILQIL